MCWLLVVVCQLSTEHSLEVRIKIYLQVILVLLIVQTIFTEERNVFVSVIKAHTNKPMLALMLCLLLSENESCNFL